MNVKTIENPRTFWCSLRAVRLHGDVCVQMIQGAVSFFATVPAALVHALDFFISPAWPLVLLRARDWHERVDCRQRMSALRVIH